MLWKSSDNFFTSRTAKIRYKNQQVQLKLHPMTFKMFATFSVAFLSVTLAKEIKLSLNTEEYTVNETNTILTLCNPVYID